MIIKIYHLNQYPFSIASFEVLALESHYYTLQFHHYSHSSPPFLGIFSFFSFFCKLEICLVFIFDLFSLFNVLLTMVYCKNLFSFLFFSLLGIDEYCHYAIPSFSFYIYYLQFFFFISRCVVFSLFLLFHFFWCCFQPLSLLFLFYSHFGSYPLGSPISTTFFFKWITYKLDSNHIFELVWVGLKNLNPIIDDLGSELRNFQPDLPTRISNNIYIVFSLLA